MWYVEKNDLYVPLSERSILKLYILPAPLIMFIFIISSLPKLVVFFLESLLKISEKWSKYQLQCDSLDLCLDTYIYLCWRESNTSLLLASVVSTPPEKAFRCWVWSPVKMDQNIHFSILPLLLQIWMVVFIYIKNPTKDISIYLMAVPNLLWCVKTRCW